MNRSDIIELANQYTERKGEKILDLNLVFASTCIDICKRGRHWWRKWDVTFNLTQGIVTYDFTVPANFTPNLTDVAVEEIIGIVLILQVNPLQTVDLTPIFDRAGIIAMKQNQTQAQPSRYTIDPTTWNKLRIDPPDKTYPAEITFWAMPNLGKETSSNTVPIIPPWHHNIIVEGMEARINKRVYGSNDSRYVTAAQSYEASIETMMMRPQFTASYDRQFVTSEDAVRSTTRISP